jgi:hypothetical protein
MHVRCRIGAADLPSAAGAAEALYQAVRDDDRPAIHAILGVADDVVSCGDATMDRRERERFVAKYAEMHRLVREPNGTTVLYVGAENWPFPFPLVARGERWRFDTAAGQREITFRRIGANEATAIEVCHAATEAPAQGGTSAAGTDSIATYAERLAAAARAGGRAPGRPTAETPFHGYRFVVMGRGGVRIVAYPAEYRTTGVMTFVVDDDGVVYERDLGPETGRVVRTLKTRPTSGWRVVV